jgi:murein DD-endopeptidase MepM/ murein hydrolase activator NlpD
VWASSAGKVVSVSQQSGSGNTIVISHANGMTTHYYHLSRFAKGLVPGQSVSQKQVIGYVGSTGLSTGPHLHFAIRQGGAFVDPFKMKIPREPSLPPRHRADFERTLTPSRAQLVAIPTGPSTVTAGVARAPRLPAAAH